MARLTDLPPEVRLKLYNLLLVDPIRDGLRVTLTSDLLDNNKTTWGRARCAQTEQPHREGHCVEPCCVDVSPFTLHHLEFTDLWSLARASKMLYVESTRIIYNNADLVYSLGDLPSRDNTLSRITAFAPLNRYFEQHSPTTTAMLHSLVIQDKFATMSARDMKYVVDIVNFYLSNLRVFHYCTCEDIASLPSSMEDCCRSVRHTFQAIQPLALLKADIRPILELPVPAGLFPKDSQLYQRMQESRHRFCLRNIRTFTTKVNGRRIMHEYHEAAPR